jgi:hypothetical protein
MRVEITDGNLLAELVEALKRGGCRADPATRRSCHVVHPLAASDNEALLEVAFFVRAWQLRHPNVGATVTPATVTP